MFENNWQKNVVKMLVGGYWGWFITDLFKHVGSIPEPEAFTNWDAAGVLFFIAVMVFMGRFTWDLITDNI